MAYQANAGSDRSRPFGAPWLLSCLVLLALLGFVARARTRAPEPAPADAPAERFSAQRAFPRLEALLAEEAPHPTGSEANAALRERLLEALREAGYRPEVQTARVQSWRGSVEVSNVLARLPGTGDGRGVLLASHYDSTASGPGASDDGVGVATLLEIAARLRKVEPLANDVVFLFSDGEEQGLLGAQAFCDEHPWFDDLELVVNLEARGVSGPSLMFQTGAHSAWIVRQFASAPRPLTSSLFDEAYRRLPNDTDFTVFQRHGLTGANFAFIGGVQHYHAPTDDLAHVSLASLQHHGDNAWHLVRRFGDADLEALPDGEAVYFDLLGLGIVQWPRRRTWLVDLAAVGMLLFVGRRWRAGGRVRIGRAAAAALTLPLAFGATWLVATVVGLPVVAADRWPVPGAPTVWPAVCLVWSSALLATTALAFPLARLARPEELALGMWSLLTLATIAATPTFAGLTFLSLVPLLVALGSAAPTRALHPMTALTTIAALGLIWLPGEYYLLDAFGWPAPGWLASRPAVLCLPLLPLLAGTSDRGKRLCAVLGLAGALVGVTAAML